MAVTRTGQLLLKRGIYQMRISADVGKLFWPPRHLLVENINLPF